MAFGKNKIGIEESDSDEGETSSLLRDIIDKEMQRDDSPQVEDETKGKKQSADIVQTPVLHTGEAGVDGDAVDYHVLKKVVDMAVKPVSIGEKIRMYYLYILIFGIVIAMMVAAFWDAFMIRGTMTWQLGFVMSLHVFFGI